MALYARSLEPSGTSMRSPLLDARQHVHCEWVGTPGASESVARIHGSETARNNLRARAHTLGSVFSSVSVEASVGARSTIFTVPVRAYVQLTTLLIGAAETLPWAGKMATFSFDVRSLTSDSDSRCEFYFGSGMGYLFFEGSIGSEFTRLADTHPWTATSFSPHLRFYPGVYEVRNACLEVGYATGLFFDGDTTDPETLMSLYEAERERETSNCESFLSWVLAC